MTAIEAEASAGPTALAAAFKGVDLPASGQKQLLTHLAVRVCVWALALGPGSNAVLARLTAEHCAQKYTDPNRLCVRVLAIFVSIAKYGIMLSNLE